MVNKIIKEIVIILLLTLAVILIAGVLLYNYAPINKIVPEKVSYTTPENVKEELKKETENEATEVVMTYKIDATDLNNYKKTKDYVAGKKNPFASVETKQDSTNSENTNGTTNNNTNTGSNSNTSVDEDEGYLPNKGTK